MEKVIFSKFSNDRKSQFRMITKIVQDKNDSKFVIKSPASYEAIGHIKKIEENYLLLENYIKNSKIKITPCKFDGKNIISHYIDGVTLEYYFCNLLYQKGTDAFLQQLQNYISSITSLAELVPFEKTEIFCRIFGEIAPENDKKAFKVSNIDMILSNLIINDDGLHLIDYEWTFNFPVPINYIIYRMIQNLFFRNQKIKNYLSLQNLLDAASINENEISIYEKMEQYFYYYVHGEDLYSKGIYDILKKEDLSPTLLTQEVDHNKIIISELNNQIDYFRTQYFMIENAFFWKITEPMRSVVNTLKNKFRNNKTAYKIWHGLRIIKSKGIRYAVNYAFSKDKMGSKENKKL